MPTLTIRHLTRYRYRRPVGFGEHRLMFRPLESYDQRIIESRLVILPRPVELRFVHDVFGNCVGIARFDAKAQEISFESRTRLEHTPAPLVTDEEDRIDAAAQTFPFAYSAEDMPDLMRSIERQHPDPERRLERWAQQFLRPRRSYRRARGALDHDPCHPARVYLRPAAVRPGAGPAGNPATGLGHVSRLRHADDGGGALARSRGAGSSSGYVYSRRNSGGPKRAGGGHTHAWVRVFPARAAAGLVSSILPNGIVGNTGLIRVAITRDPRQAAPLHGSYDGAAEGFPRHGC